MLIKVSVQCYVIIMIEKMRKTSKEKQPGNDAIQSNKGENGTKTIRIVLLLFAECYMEGDGADQRTIC